MPTEPTNNNEPTPTVGDYLILDDPKLLGVDLPPRSMCRIIEITKIGNLMVKFDNIETLVELPCTILPIAVPAKPVTIGAYAEGAYSRPKLALNAPVSWMCLRETVTTSSLRGARITQAVDYGEDICLIICSDDSDPLPRAQMIVDMWNKQLKTSENA